MSKEFNDTAESRVRRVETVGGSHNESAVAGGGISVESLESLPVFYLGKDDALAQGLARFLARRGVFFTRLESVEIFVASGQTLPPCLLLLDTAMVPKSQTISQIRDAIAVSNPAQVRLVCLAHSVELPLRLQALRAGARAFFLLPVDLATLANKLLDLCRVARSDQPRILIVDDEAVAALFAARVLQDAGMETRSVTDPMLVMDALEGFQPDLILMDLYMPAVSGVELVTIIREHDSFFATPIVFLSGEIDADKQRAALRVGGDEFLAKPVPPKSLVATVEHRIRLFRSTHDKEGDAGSRDRMTGLFNRRHFLRRIEAALSAMDSESGDAAVLCVAIDRPEAIVARVGISGLGGILEQISDLLLQQVGQRVCAARIGEASIGFLTTLGEEGAAGALGRVLVDRVADANIRLDPLDDAVSVSVGVGSLAPSSDDALTALLRAERICEVASKAGGRRVKVAATRMANGGGERVLQLLRQALQTGGFLLLFQPVVSLHGGSGEYYDVQLRLKMGPEELISPAEFLPVADLAGLSGEIDRWVMDHVLDVLQAHRADGRTLHLFVPQVLTTLTDLGYLQWLSGELVSRMLGDLRPIMQFSQTDLIDHLPVAAKRFPMIDRLGMPICIRDFEDEPGALMAVEKLPISTVRSTAETVARVGTVRMQRSVAALHALKARIIAEGIDNSQDIGRAWDCGLDFIQGNFLQPPQEGLTFDFGVMPFAVA